MGQTQGKDGSQQHGKSQSNRTPVKNTTTAAPVVSSPATARKAGDGIAAAAAEGGDGPSKISLRAVQATCGKGEGVPTVIRWTGGKAGEVMVEGTFTNWSKGAVTLKRTDSEWLALVYLQPGYHAFRFFVDGRKGVVDAGQPRFTHVKGDFNYVTVSDQVTLNSDEDDASPTAATTTDIKPYTAATPTEKDSYTQTKWVFEETRKLPPLFPPHLRYTPLTTAPEARPTQELELPIPYHVTINHMYFQAREGYNVLGATFRYSDKYSTVVYYRQQEYEESGEGGHVDPNEEVYVAHQPVPMPRPKDPLY